MRMEKLIITIDGPAGTGKTTIAKLLADRLKIAYLDSGAMFRTVAYILGENSWLWEKNKLLSKLYDINFTLKGVGKDSELLINNKPLPKEIRTEKVGLWASLIGQKPEVREHIKRMEQKIGRETSLVAEGRDMGTVVFPWAKYKFFLDASLEERAKRRYLQLKNMGVNVDFEQLKEEIRIRDEQDRNREIAPLKRAKDAILIDTTDLTIDEVLEKILSYIHI